MIGNDPELKKGQQGIAGIQEPLPVAQVIAGEENLCHHLLMAREMGLIDVHQPALSHSGGCLFLGDGLGTGLIPQFPHPRGNRPGRDQDDLIALVFQL